jgi:hypothetical protein
MPSRRSGRATAGMRKALDGAADVGAHAARGRAHSAPPTREVLRVSNKHPRKEVSKAPATGAAGRGGLPPSGVDVSSMTPNGLDRSPPHKTHRVGLDNAGSADIAFTSSSAQFQIGLLLMLTTAAASGKPQIPTSTSHELQLRRGRQLHTRCGSHA